ncbi:hypothetical protein B0H19DRAFT_1129807 [Mycena capillaripes]|nr:hypothetical protein B0H19DRAFT_1129807 [Mycena capillaripes]
MDRKRPIPGCLEGTRKRIFKKIDTWLADSSSPNILWIKGFPESGKSCIARSVVQKLVDTPRFGSSFFFERDDGGFTAPSTMLRRISSDLCHHPAFMGALVTDLEMQPRMIDFSTASIADQFHRLVEKPLQNLANGLKNGEGIVVVVDALDECGGFGRTRFRDRSDVLNVIKRWCALSPLLRLVVTSRDETSISEVLGPISTPLELHLDNNQAKRDIEMFLDLELRKIGERHCLPNWPTVEQIRILVDKAKGLFVWAATLVQFLDQPMPQDILQQILHGDMNVEGDITDLYELILEISFCPGGQQPSAKFLAEFTAFVGALVTANGPLEKGNPLFRIIGVQSATADSICSQLRSVMVPAETYLRFSHQSFVDFLLSESCPSIFRITPRLSRRNISLAILNLLNSCLRFDPSEFRTSHRSNPKTKTQISADLAFACRTWGDTLPAVGEESGDANLLASLKAFFETNLLFWLEALSLTGQMSCALFQLFGAKESIGVCDEDLSIFVADAIAFVETFHECISKSAPHVYLSAMAFIPENSKVSQTYSASLQSCASVTVQTADGLRSGRSAIPAPITYIPCGDEVAASFEGHVDDIRSTIFIQDGYVASASHDGTIRFWAPSSGAPILMPFTNNTEPITSLAFSKHRMLLVSGSGDGDASVWDMRSHEMLTAFQHDSAVTCVALSPTGSVAVVGCKNGTVKFWNIGSRQECRPAFREHTKRVTAVVFLEGGIAISGSLDKSICIHHMSGHSEVFVRTDRRIHSLAILEAPRALVAACDRCINIWNLSDKNVPGDPICLVKHSDEIESIAAHGTRIAAAVGKKIEIWDVVCGKFIPGPLTGHTSLVTSVAFSQDGLRLVSGSINPERSIRVWDVGGEKDTSLGGFPDGSEIEPTGWIRGPEPKRDLIIWVPESHRRRLCWGRTVAVMDGKPAVYLSVSESLLGRRWYKCRRHESE